MIIQWSSTAVLTYKFGSQQIQPHCFREEIEFNAEHSHTNNVSNLYSFNWHTSAKTRE